MDSELSRKFSRELNGGMTSLALLAVMIKAKRPMYGYELGMELAGVSDDGLPMNQGALYPVLRTMERVGLLTSETRPSDAGPPRRYYSPTALGKAELKQWRDVWVRTRNWLDEVLEHDTKPSSTRRTTSRS